MEYGWGVCLVMQEAQVSLDQLACLQSGTPA